ncbi:MAG: PQQ-binding-like beta-propeller repeat protein [Prevotellaceae bacterium]|jgi:outer membrane protein assembly factor BamB|nr:PQQ-binding-like beta-propeller repeat protein [Prevotellaceae bacterium]
MKTTILFLCSLLVAAALSAQDNKQWRGNRTGVYGEPGLLKSWPAEGPKILWHYDGLGEGHSSVAISSDKLYVTGLTGDKGYIYVLDLQGNLLNKKEYGNEWNKSYNGSRGTITINEGKLYLISGVGDIVCLDEKTLDVVWKKNMLSDFSAKNITWGICESPLIVGEKLIATPGGKEHNIVALNKNTGELIWSTPAEGDLSAYCSPLYVGDQQTPQVVTMTAKHIVGVDVATGKLLWSFENINRHAVHPNIPVYSNNQLLCTSGYGKGSVMLRLTEGGRSVEKMWDAPELDSRIGAMVKIGDYAYGSGDANKYWFCVDWKTGKLLYKDSSLPIGAVIANNDMLYCYSDRGDLALAKATPEKFDVVSKASVTLGTDQHWAHPVIHKGTLYLRHGNTLIAYSVK